MSKELITLGNRVREERKRQGLSQESLAELIGVSTNTVSRIEGGQTAMSVDVFRKIVQELALRFIKNLTKIIVDSYRLS